LTGFFIYKGELFAQTKKDHPDAKVTEITKLISEKWRNIDKATKEIYDKKVEEAKAKYEKDVQEYEAAHGPIEKKKRTKKNMTNQKEKIELKYLILHPPFIILLFLR